MKECFPFSMKKKRMLSFQYEKKECCPRDDGISEIKVIFTAIRCQCEGKKML